jgi:transcriptional regulator with XRE-family HTH domain
VSRRADAGDHAPVSRTASVAILLGRRLRALRKARKLTQEELGEKSRLSGKFIGEIERGVGNPTLEVLVRVAAALDVHLDQMVRFEETTPRGAAPNAARGFVAAERVAEYLSGRPPDEIERALRILEAALGQEDTE